MKVRMKVAISGDRNGAAWPPRGGTVDLPRAEAAQMCARGLAEAIKDAEPPVETATDKEPVETRGDPAEARDDRTPPRRGRPPKPRDANGNIIRQE